MEKLYRARVAVFGIGGVGGYTVETLARSGIGMLSTYKVFTSVGHGGLIAEHTEQFIEEVKAVHGASTEQ